MLERNRQKQDLIFFFGIFWISWLCSCFSCPLHWVTSRTTNVFMKTHSSNQSGVLHRSPRFPHRVPGRHQRRGLSRSPSLPTRTGSRVERSRITSASLLTTVSQQSVFEPRPGFNFDSAEQRSVGVRRIGRRGYLELLYLQSCGNPSPVWEI